MFSKSVNDLVKENTEIVVDIIPLFNRLHPAVNTPATVFLFGLQTGKSAMINILHYDLPTTLTLDDVKGLFLELEKTHVFFVFNRKRILHFLNLKSFDLSLLHKHIDSDIVENFDNYNLRGEEAHVTPLSIHLSLFKKKCKTIDKSVLKNVTDSGFMFYNSSVSENLQILEQNGISVDIKQFSQHFPNKEYLVKNGLVYSEYNFYTLTGRPANSFGGVNYSALNKKTGCRKAFNSRYGNTGCLYMLDFSAFHPCIIAKLIGYKFPEDVNVYEYLGKQMFPDMQQSELISTTKKTIFQNIYGNMNHSLLKIPYFFKIAQYCEKLWADFQTNGFISTPVYQRKILNIDIPDPSRTKVFNYMLQAAEVEFSFDSIDKINKFLKTKKTKLILYTYDSLLFDVALDVDGLVMMKDLKHLMQQNDFRVKSFAGKNYDEMILIDV